EGRFLLFPVIRSRSGPSHILAAVKTLSPPLTAPELGTALLALWDRWEGTPCWEELPPELTAVPFWKGTARSYRAFFRAHRLIVAAFGHPNPGDISLAYWPRHLENNIWGVVKGQVELQVRLDRELPDLPRKIGMAARQLLAAAELTDPTMPATGNNRRYCFYLSYIIENKKIFLGGRTFMAHPTYGLNELREMFLKFFETKEHLRLPSFSLIPQNDASLLLINSGMAPMKPWFTGEEEPPRHRVCTCQKCIRTGDIENIGKTARHGTYFEMLGNFSFGDYFKRDAIHWAWEFLTSPEWVGLEPDRLYPSVFAGNETTPADDEAFAIWRDEIGIPEDRIFKFGKEYNFWEHGSGPCGPCSEIYYDRGPEWGCGKPGCTVGCDCDRYIEVWNVVFSQFDNDGEGHYTELKQKNIDTGMGLERLACVSQNVASLFDVDTVMNITNKVSEITGAKYEQSDKIDVSLRVITDHIRSATFMICDGVLPSNEGRGYVLRRLLRRAARHGKLLGVNHPFLYEVCDTVVHENEGHYPELRERQAYITKVIRTEEENFAKTLDAGMKIYDDMLSAHKAQGETVFSGADAFKLYDTYGFPIDLTVEMAEEAGMTVDQEGFKALMEEQKVRARKAREALGDLGWAGIEFGKDMPATEFVGYDRSSEQGRVLALVADGELRDELAQGVEGILVLDQT
ncbi:methionine--tRNA ligase, partial [Dysosmobacter welbionis]